MRALLLTLLAAGLGGRPAAAETTSASLPALHDCQLNFSVSVSETRACEPVTLTARLAGPNGGPVAGGYITFASDGGANPALPVPLSGEGIAFGNSSGLLPGVRQLTATYSRGGGRASTATPAAPASRLLPSHCQEGTSPPIALGVTRGVPAVSVTAVPASGLAPGTPTGCDLGKTAFYVSVLPKAAAAQAGGGSSGCATPTGVVSVYLVRGALAADQVGEWDGPVSNAAATAVSGLRDGAATAVSAAATAALGGGGGSGSGGGAAQPAAPVAAAVVSHLLPGGDKAANRAIAAAAGNGGGPASVLPDTLTALVQSAARTAGKVTGGGGEPAAAGQPAAPVAAAAAAAAGVAPPPPPPPAPPVAAAAPAATAPATAVVDTLATPPLPAVSAQPPLPTPPAAASATIPSTTAGDLPAALHVFVDTFNAEVGGGGGRAGVSVPAAVASATDGAAPAHPLPAAAVPASPLPPASSARGEVAPAKARSSGRALQAPFPSLPSLPASPPFSNLASARAAAPLLGHRLLGVGVLVPADFLPGAPASATVKPGSRTAGAGGVPRPPPPGSPGGLAPLLPGAHTIVVTYSGDDVFERGVGVTDFDIADGCGIL